MTGEMVSGRWLGASILWVLLVWFTLGTAAAAQDPAPRSFSPAFLEDGTPVQDQFEGNVTARLYAFNGSKGDLISLFLRGEFDAYLVLFGSGGEFLAYNDDGEEAFGDSELIDFELPYSGRYYVLATSYEHLDGILVESQILSEPQPYEIVLTGNTPPAEGDLVALEAVHVTAGERTEHMLTAEQPIGFYAFEGRTDEVIRVSAVSEDVMYLTMHLFAPDGSRIGLTHDPEDTLLDNLTLPLDGDYLVMTMDAFFVDRLLPNAGDYGLGSVTVTLEN